MEQICVVCNKQPGTHKGRGNTVVCDICWEFYEEWADGMEALSQIDYSDEMIYPQGGCEWDDYC